MPGELVGAVKSSPAREEAHDPASWFPLVAVGQPTAHRGSVRPAPSRPAVVVRRSPARETAHDPASWFPVSELEALLAPERLVPESAPLTVTPVVAEPSPAPASVPEPTQTRAEIQRARRARRVRRRVRLAVAGVGLGAGLLLARAHLTGGSGSEVVADAERGMAQTGAAPGAGGDAAGEMPVAQPIEPTAFEAVPTSAVVPPPPPPPPPPLPNEEIWERMAQCETGGNWQHRGPTWSGGLGIYRGTWLEAGGREFAPLPRDATREEQILVAERIRERHGWTAWGCARAIGMG